MAKVKKIDATVDEINKLSKSDKIVIGTERTMKQLKLERLSKVFLSSNAPQKIRADFIKYGKLAGVDIVNLKYSNEEIGEICKKPFLISVLGQLK